jgi:hypothetical protein
VQQDSTFAREFIDLEGPSKLKDLIAEAAGNTLAYGLTAFAKLLQVADVQVEVFAVVDKPFTDRVFAAIYSDAKHCRLQTWWSNIRSSTYYVQRP